MLKLSQWDFEKESIHLHSFKGSLYFQIQDVYERGDGVSEGWVKLFRYDFLD